MLFARQDQELFQLGAEELGARRVFEGQCGQCVDDPVRAGVGAVAGLDADDGNDNCRVDAVGLFGFFQNRRVRTPEIDAAIDATLGHEYRPVFVPGFAFRRPRYGFQDVVALAGTGEQRLELIAIELVTLHHFGDKCLCFGIAIKITRRHTARGEPRAQPQQ